MNNSNGPLVELSSLDGAGKAGRVAHDTFNPDDFEAIRLRRILAYAIDVVCIALITFVVAVVGTLLGVMTFGLLSPLFVLIIALTPLSYHTLLVGGPASATLGMRFMNIRMERMTGEKPDYVVAFIHAVIFYLSIGVTSSLILLVSLFNPRGRLLQDYLLDTVVRRIPLK
ncbi:RDD family protein [Sneathiella sp.]|uniref:RDD family protein n=1 Tax=Sneathiella sp. TaxID=1964365 RepID=UPI002FDF4AC4